MTKLEVKKAASAGLLSIGLVVGMAGLAGAMSGDIDTTGPLSDNEISHESRVDLEVDNDNDLDLDNRSEQRASSGDAEVRWSTTGGSAMTGAASNASAVAAEIEIDNSQSAASLSDFTVEQDTGSASIENTGPRSDNVVEFESRTDVEIRNDNDVRIDNNVEQSARSGDAEVRFNTTGGDAVTGDVSNTSSSSFTVRVTN